MNKSRTACFSGYRPEKFPFPLEAGCEAYINLQADITRAIGESVLDGYTRFSSGMARGFDLVCSAILLEMKKMSSVYADIDLVAVLPFEGHGFKGRWGLIHDMVLEEGNYDFVMDGASFNLGGNVSAGYYKSLNSKTSNYVEILHPDNHQTALFRIRNQNAVEGSFEYSIADKALNLRNVAGPEVRFYVNGGEGQTSHRILGLNYSNGFLMSINATARPWSDNTYSLGTASYHFSQIYAANGSIVTSDERLKTDIEPVSNALLDAIDEVDIALFRFKDSVDEKGDKARIHAGIVAQRFIEACGRHGVDPFKLGMLCYDEWPGSEEKIITEPVCIQEEELDEQGNVITPAKYEDRVMEIVPAVEAGNRYSIRYDQFFALKEAARDRTLRRMEEKIKALTGAI